MDIPIKEQFRTYLANCVQTRRQTGKSFIIGRTTVDSYVSFAEVDKLFDYAPEKWQNISSIYDITSSKDVLDIIDVLSNDDEFKVRDSTESSQYFRSNAIKQYYCFLKAREIFIGKSEAKVAIHVPSQIISLQRIFYGAPGTGKSNTIKREVDQKGLPKVRTTFHPDSDYSTFVGAYKPTSVEVPVMTMIGTKAVPAENPDGTPRKEMKIVYEFVPQAFLKAYTGAWKNQNEPFFLIIEEINRGNCAQIFGDLFQLLDRNDETGLSEYPISPDEDIQKFLLTDKKYGFAALTEEQKEAIPEEVLSGELMILPQNLHIWATMNTSDQSLFPIDSAFKRRWDWQYIPISDGKKGWAIEANGNHYDWWQFLRKMNDQIGSTTNSEDKKLGYYFCKATNGIINAETFVGKVVFYIWNDVFKDFAEEAGDLFKDEDGSLLSFNKFYTVGEDRKTMVVEEKVMRLLQNLGVMPTDYDIEEDTVEDEDGNTISSSSRDYSKFSINGIGKFGKNKLASECMKKYIELNPVMPVETVLANWRKLGNIVPHFVESKEEYEARTDNSRRSYGIPCGDSVVYVTHDGFGNNGKVFTLIEAVNNMDWGITLSKVEE